MKNNFHAATINRFWDYQQLHFPQWEGLLERGRAEDGRPPVFLKDQAWRNVLSDAEATTQSCQRLLGLIPVYERHRWFGSMSSSQALAQSVLGNLFIHEELGLLNDIEDEEGQPVFGKMLIKSGNFSFEKKVTHLGEPRSTSLDAFISGEHPIAIECKFTEQEMGSCSRPRLRPVDSNYQEAHCNGRYEQQRGRKSRCSLTEIGVRYWEFIPRVFHWQNDADINPCPLGVNYQLARNLLSVAVNPAGEVTTRDGHVVLIYDERNPAFGEGGKGYESFHLTREKLLNQGMLMKCSWQQIIKLMRERNILPKLTGELSLKYGF